MPLAVFKYHLPRQGIVAVDMPVGARPLAVADRRGRLCLWAAVVAEAPHVATRFCVLSTGVEVDRGLFDWPHIGTVLRFDDSEVLHVFGPLP